MNRRDGSLRYRWLYSQHNIQVEENVVALQDLLRRARAADYNGVLLADYKMGILDLVPDWYFENLAAVKQTADELGIALFPVVCSCGADNAVLAHDPNLAASVPVRDAVFVVEGRTADIVSENLLPGGGFETMRGNTFSNWDWHDPAVLDTTVKHSGDASLRFDEPVGNARVCKLVKGSPFRQYHLSVWIKTDAFRAADEVRCTVLADEGTPSLCHTTWSAEPTQDWTEFHAVFNSLENTGLNVYIGARGASGGKLWLDDARLEEVGFLNLVRRESCSLAVTGDDGTLYTEGLDFVQVVDPRMGQVPYPGGQEVWHTPPALVLTPTSRIRDGQRLAVSFFHTLVVKKHQSTASLVDPRVFAIHEDILARATKALDPPGFFFSHDELRIANWDGECLALDETPARLLAAHVGRCAALARRASPHAEQFVWSDMFDPHHNAHDDFYLVRGTLEGSWEGLPREMIVVNWNSWKQKESLSFFAGRGHRQILAGYYDDSPYSIRDWLDTAESLGGANVVGAMYTTWRGDFALLEAFARAAWG